MRIGLKLILIIVIIALVSNILSGTVYYFIAKQAIEERTNAQLKSVSVLKENQLNDLIEEEIRNLENIAKEESLLDNFIRILKARHDPDKTIYYENIKNFFKKKLIQGDFTEFFVLDLEGKIRISTNKINEGKIKSNENYFIKGKEETFVQSFFYDITLRQPSMIISTPMKDYKGNVIGVLAGRVELRKISELMLERSGLGETGETYLVNKFNLVVTELRKEKGAALKRIIHTEGVKDCLKGGSGYKNYNDYKNTPVIGMYTWIPEREVCLLAKIDREEAFIPIIKIGYYIISISIFVVILVIALGFYFSRSLTSPIKKLRDTALEIGKGKLDISIKIKSKDEIGELAATFNQMARDLRKSREEIRKHTEELEKRVQERTKELDKRIEELTNTKAALLNMMEDMGETNKKLIKLRRELKRSLKEIKEADVKKNEFISIASHELKTPLTAIHGFSQLLQSPKIFNDYGKSKKYLKIMEKETQRLSKIVNDMLSLSRIDLGTIKQNLEETDIKKFMEDIERETKRMIKEKGLKYEFKIDENLSRIITDKEKLTEILLNLINNAVKYTPKGKIIVKAFKEKNNIHFVVKDTGIGISKENQKKIFDRFYQVDSSYTRKASGTGLGLSLCKEYLELMGGKIWIKSKLGRGSEFHFIIPIKPEK